jgi:hypothetical protein
MPDELTYNLAYLDGAGRSTSLQVVHEDHETSLAAKGLIDQPAELPVGVLHRSARSL